MLGMCIGERNLKIYIQYILVLLLGALHIACTSFLCVVIESSQLKSWNTFKRILYWLLCAAASYMAVLLCFYLGKMMQRLSRNITKEEAKIKSFWNKVQKCRFRTLLLMRITTGNCSPLGRTAWRPTTRTRTSRWRWHPQRESPP